MMVCFRQNDQVLLATNRTFWVTMWPIVIYPAWPYYLKLLKVFLNIGPEESISEDTSNNVNKKDK